MSKVVKQMQMDALKKSFGTVRDMVVLSIKGLSATNETLFRAALRKKNIRLTHVKNTYTRRVFKELDINVPVDSPFWANNTVLAMGGTSVSELSRGIEGELKAPKTAAVYKDKVTIKGAIADGTVIKFDVALKMPTRQEAIANVLGALLGPAANLVAALKGPAAGVAGQIKTIAEKKEETPPEETPAPTPA